MIVELGVPTWLVALMVSLPLVFAPLARADRLPLRHPPLGAGLAAGALHLVRHAAAVRRLRHHALRAAGPVGRHHRPAWVGQAGAALAFLLVGAGLHTTQTAGLALATDLAPDEARPRVVALLYVMLLVGMVASALVFGALLADFSQIRLIQVIQGRRWSPWCLNIVASGSRSRAIPPPPAPTGRAPDFRQSWRALRRARRARAGCWSRSGWAPRPSACRTSCWSPMAARSCNLGGRRDDRAHGAAGRRHAGRLRARRTHAGPRRRSLPARGASAPWPGSSPSRP